MIILKKCKNHKLVISVKNNRSKIYFLTMLCSPVWKKNCSSFDKSLIFLQPFQFQCRMAPSTRRIQSMIMTLSLILPVSLIRYCEPKITLF